MAPKIAIVYVGFRHQPRWLQANQYSLHGHIRQLAQAEKEGIEKAGGKVDVYQVEETLPGDVLTKMYAAPKDPDVPVLSDPKVLEQYDGFLLGIPTRFGNFPAQWKTFWDRTGQQWTKGGYYGKYVGVFLGTAGLGGGQESTALASLSTFAHHGLIYVPLGYNKTFPDMANLSEVHGGGPWGAGTFSASDGSRQPTELELRVARTQGEVFYQTLARVNF